MQGNPISLTDPFGLCPEGGGILDYLKLAGHTLLDLAGFIPDLVNSTDEMTFLTQEYGVEFAQVYKYGKGPNGGGGQYYLYSGTVNKVRVPIANDIMLINHTYPS